MLALDQIESASRFKSLQYPYFRTRSTSSSSLRYQRFASSSSTKTKNKTYSMIIVNSTRRRISHCLESLCKETD